MAANACIISRGFSCLQGPQKTLCSLCSVVQIIVGIGCLNRLEQLLLLLKRKISFHKIEPGL